MHTNLDRSKLHIALNGEFVTRKFSMELIEKVEIGKKIKYTATGQEFTIAYKGVTDQGLHKYRLNVLRRFFINDRYNIIAQPNKAQKIALQVAKLNDTLDFEISRNFKLMGITNGTEILNKWSALKPSLLKTYPDLQTVISDFEWQLQDENIQDIFKRDNFYTFFFSGIFYHDFEETPILKTDQMITNALPGIDIPVKLKKSVFKNDYLFNNASVVLKGTLDSDHPKYNATRIQQFIDKTAAPESQLQFEYYGLYQTKPRKGLVTEGSLSYSFEFPEYYKKTTTINFNLENDE
ncbi:hypothetical protein N9954_05370 [Maribacter sp.]|nr:hypothetical protein [Maribacter sp.]